MQMIQPIPYGLIIRIISLQSDESLASSTLVQAIAEMEPPSILFGEHARVLNVFHGTLLSLIDARGVNLKKYRSRGIMVT